MHFERHREVSAAADKAPHPEFRVFLESENANLDRVDERMKKRAFVEFLIEYDDVKKGQRIHVSNFGRLETEGADLRIEIGDSDTGSAEFDYADFVKHLGRKIGPKRGFEMLAERDTHGSIVLALLAEIRCEPSDSLRDLRRRGLDESGSRVGRDDSYDRGIEIVKVAGGLRRFAEDIATSKPDEIVSGITE